LELQLNEMKSMSSSLKNIMRRTPPNAPRPYPA
jgi:hypothetical protein